MKLRLLEYVSRPTLRALRLLGATSLALGLALGLPGCGPGTGGTGTGFPMNTAQPGNAQWFLGSWRSIASAADGTNASAPVCISPGPAPCAATAVMLDVTAAGIGVDAACWGFVYDGTLGDSAGLNLRVTGLYTAPAASGGVATQTADLLIETRDADVLLTVLDTDGRVLQGPVVLMRSPGGAEARPVSNPCPGHDAALVKG